MLATLLVYHLTAFQFVIRIYHAESSRLLPFRVLKRLDSLSQLISLSLFSAFLSIFPYSPQFSSSIFLFFYTPFLLLLFLSFLFKSTFFYKFPVQYFSVLRSTPLIFLGLTGAEDRPELCGWSLCNILQLPVRSFTLLSYISLSAVRVFSHTFHLCVTCIYLLQDNKIAKFFIVKR